MDDGKEFEWLDEENCCEEYKKYQEGKLSIGTHYHCPRCGAVTGMYGHHVTSCKFLGGSWSDPARQTEFHLCCPDFCALGNHLAR